MVKMLDLLEEYCVAKHYHVERLDGNTKITPSFFTVGFVFFTVGIYICLGGCACCSAIRIGRGELVVGCVRFLGAMAGPQLTHAPVLSFVSPLN